MSRSSWSRKVTQIRRPIPPVLYWTLGLATFVIPAILWWLLTRDGSVDPIFLPSPSKVGDALVSLSESGRLWSDIYISVWRVTVGFLIAAAVALPLGILMGTFHVAEATLEPMVNFIRYMPAAAFIPLLMLYVGIDESSKISIIFIGTYFQLILMVSAEVRNVPIDLAKVAYTLGARKSHVLLQVIVPASLPGLIEALRITLGWAWTYLVVAELIAADQGLGFRIMESQRFLKTEVIFLYIIIIGLLGLLFDQAIKFAARKVVPWAESFEK